MTTRPYATADLRVEAARQHAAAARDHDLTTVGEEMRSGHIDSTVTDPDAAVTTRAGSLAWDMLGFDDFQAAQRAVRVLLEEAADTSEWAVALGADGFQPDSRHVDIDNGAARLHIAFRADVTDEQRATVLGVIAIALGGRLTEACRATGGA